MVIRFGILVFFWLCPFLGWGQELIWEKRIPLSTYESFSDVVKLSDGNFLALGYSRRWRMLNPVENGAILMKFNENGDTLWTRWTGYYGGFGGIERVSDNLFYALFGYWDVSTNSYKTDFLLITGEGDILGTLPIQVAPGESLMDMKVKDGYIWICGEKNPSIFYPGGLGFDFLLKKLRMDGSEVFSLVYNGNNQTSRGRMMEFMPNGNILFSGSAGRDLCSFEIDTAGNQLQFRTYLQNPLNSGWQDATVKQMPQENKLLFAHRSSVPSSHYLGKTDSSGLVLWGGFSRGGSTIPMVFEDGSIIHINNIANPETSLIRRLSADSSVIWSLNLIGNGTVPGRKSIRDTWFESDSSGVCVGTITPSSSSFTNLYIAKFGGFGTPFDPTSAQALENLKTDAAPLPFPNPGGDQLKFTLLAGPGRVTFTDALGKTVWEGDYHPEKGINTRSFRPGVYHYRLERKGKVWGGKWVKE